MGDKQHSDTTDKYASLLLDNQLCFPLYVCAKEIIKSYAPYLSDLGLTYTQYITMMVMWEEKQTVLRHLKERLYLDSGTLTPVLKKLEEKGYITRSRSEKDARDLVISVTPLGEELKEKAVLVPGQVQKCISCMDVKDAVKLKELLDDMMAIFTNSSR